MSDLKISQMTPASYLNGSELVPIVQINNNKQVNLDSLLSFTNKFTQLTSSLWDGSNKYVTMTSNLNLTLNSIRNAGLLYVVNNNNHTLTINATTMSINNTSDSIVGYIRYDDFYVFAIENNPILMGTSGSGSGGGPGTGSGEFDADYLSYVSRIESTGYIYGTGEKEAENDFIVALKSNGLYTKIYEMYLFTGNSSGSHAIPFKGVVPNISWVGAVTSSANGTSGNGINAYGNLGWSPVSMSQNDAHVSIYSRTNTALTHCDVGSFDGTGRTQLYIKNATSKFAGTVQGTVVTSANDIASSTGLFLVSRNAAGSTDSLIFYQTGSVVEKFVNVSVTPSTSNFYFMARNNNGTADTFSSRQYCFMSFGTKMNDTEASTFNTLVQTLQTAKGRAV